MKLKHFLRGLGAGMIFATLVLSISFSLYGYKMSEEAIVEEALELGMVWPDRNSGKDTEQTTTTEPSTTTETPTTTEAPTTTDSVTVPTTTTVDNTTEPSTTKQDESTTPVETSTTEEPTTSEQPTTTEAPTTEPTTTEIPTTEVPTTEAPTTEAPKAGSARVEDGKAYVTVPKGLNSVQVSKLLKSVGAIDDVYKFDAYVVKQGYGGRIQIGTHVVPLGSTYDEIIKIICGLK